MKRNYDVFNADKNLTKAFIHLAKSIKDNEDFQFLITAGGFMHFEWPSFYSNVNVKFSQSKKLLTYLEQLAALQIERFWNSLPIETRQKIQAKIKFITFGVDSNNKKEDGKIIQCVQFVGLFSTSKQKIIHWTGKSYPTTYDQKCGLILFDDLNSHFKKVNNDTVCILGCHDLKMFSPRSKAIAGPSRQRKIKQFDKLMKRYKPNIVLQHPHNTDVYTIWNTEWKMVEKHYPFVEDYASSIRYHNYNRRKRSTLKSVISKTFMGNVRTVVY